MSRMRRNLPLLFASGLLLVSIQVSLASESSSKNTSALRTDALIGQVIELFDNEGNPTNVRIEAVELDDNQANDDVFLYSLSVFNTFEGDWQNVCLPDLDGQTKAIFMQGHWDQQGRYVDSSQLSFGCTSGVLAKCVRWGYKPWLDTPELPMKALHQACSRMARADYCGDGVGHTKDGTAINIFDVYGVQRQDEVDGMKFEAAWNAEGAVAIDHGRYAPANQIIAKCPNKLQQHEVSDRNSLPLEDLKRLYPNALMFNESYVQPNN